MAATLRNGAPTIFPALRYNDAPAAIDWLGRAFGFARHMVVPGPEGTVAHAQLTFGSGMIMLGSARPPDAANPWTTERQGLYVHVEDVDAHYARAKAAGAEIVMALRSTEYGSREYSARDLDGHLWSFGSYLPDPAEDADKSSEKVP
jgi:uncharacterized glyoxalase superfamily protein PhnB